MKHLPLIHQMLLALAGSVVLPGAAHAAAPQLKTQAPGYYRVMLGDFEVTALSDGTVALPVDKLLTGTTAAKICKALARSLLKAPLDTSVNGHLGNTGSKLVLIDTGAASLFSPTLGNLLVNLKAAGYQPEQVDEINMTRARAGQRRATRSRCPRRRRKPAPQNEPLLQGEGQAPDQRG